jgi:beta-lactamase superfamily II metal-dependent hydrolase
MKYKLISTAIVLFLSISVYSQNTQNYEAEDAITNDSVQILNDISASGGKCLLFDKYDSVNWVCEAKTEGWYKISVRYKAIKGDVAQNILINGKKQGVGFSICNNWNDAYFDAYLRAGKNNISLLPGYGQIHIDFLSLPYNTTYFKPSLSPINGAFYKKQPATISVFANAKGKKLKSVYAENNTIGFQTEDFPHIEGAYHIKLSNESLARLPIGNHNLHFTFNDGSFAQYNLKVKDAVKKAGLTLIMFDIEHGNSVLVILPNGKRLLIDSGKEEYARSVIMPFLDRNKIEKIDYFIITHYHDDHTGAKDEIIKKYNVSNFYDYKSFNAGDTVKLDQTIVSILNTFADGTHENDQSLSFLLSWNGFTYSHGADNYANTQDRILKKYGSSVLADVFYANHHFHGSVNPEFIIKTNPSLVVVSAEQSVYARGAFTEVYKEKTEKVLYSAHARLKETLLTLEVGTIVIRINGAGDWDYETYRDWKDIKGL